MTSGGTLVEREIDPREWHVDLSTDYVTNFRRDIGFSIGFLPRDFATDGLSAEDFIAEPVHFPAWGGMPSDDELAHLRRVAALLYARRFLQSMRAAHFTVQGPEIDEDAA